MRFDLPLPLGEGWGEGLSAEPNSREIVLGKHDR